MIQLPPAPKRGAVSLEEALWGRRSVRDFREDPLELGVVARLLWAAQGLSGGRRARTAPSAGALYPLELYLVAGAVEGLSQGTFRYHPHEHALLQVAEGDRREVLAGAAYAQPWVAAGAALVAVAGCYERTAAKYGEKGVRYVHLEAGHAAQNLQLQAGVLGLGSVCVGAFDGDEVARLVPLAKGETPLYLIPVGKT
ncbi:MAG: SagB/ThcOx family dehydrogenase [Deferrisomatales bacterium]